MEIIIVEIYVNPKKINLKSEGFKGILKQISTKGSSISRSMSFYSQIIVKERTEQEMSIDYQTDFLVIFRMNDPDGNPERVQESLQRDLSDFIQRIVNQGSLELTEDINFQVVLDIPAKILPEKMDDEWIHKP